MRVFMYLCVYKCMPYGCLADAQPSVSLACITLYVGEREVEERRKTALRVYVCVLV